MNSNSPPQILGGRYALREPIGKGGMAIVYQAEDRTLDRIVAIKIMLPNLAAQLGHDRFIRESHTLARLNHPNIMQVFDAGSTDGWQYLVLEYIPGKSLFQIIRDHEALSLPQILAICDELLSALEYAHQHDLIHRDIKPENIMILPDGHVKVMDFGLALSLEEPRLTNDDSVVGTVFYMAPEIFEGAYYTDRSDLYAVGAVCYEMVTGSPPFVGDTMLTIASQVIQGQLTPPKQANPAIPEMLDAFILRLLDRNPDKRYPSAREARQALSAIALDDDFVPDTNLNETRIASRLERILRTSSQHALALDSDDEEETIADFNEPHSQALMVFAVQEDLMEALESERRRIAGIVQENITSQLSLLMSQIAIYEQSFANQPPFKMAISVVSTLLKQVMQQSRDIESSLYSPVLESLGLEPALEMLCSQEMRVHGVHISLRLQRLRERLPAHIELLLYRATQEIIHHACTQLFASQMRIVLEKQVEGVIYSIDHNGTGLMESHLHATRQRIESLGGSLMSESQAHESSIRIQFPIELPIDLTERELDVLRLIAEGLTNKEIAQILFISIRTVKFHLDNIYSKLGIRSRTEAAIFAIRRGIVRKAPVLKDS